MIQFLVHEKADTVGVATVDIKAGETAAGLYMDTQENVEVKANNDVPLGHKIALQDQNAGEKVLCDIPKCEANRQRPDPEDADQRLGVDRWEDDGEHEQDPASDHEPLGNAPDNNPGVVARAGAFDNLEDAPPNAPRSEDHCNEDDRGNHESRQHFQEAVE